MVLGDSNDNQPSSLADVGHRQVPQLEDRTIDRKLALLQCS